VIAIENTRLFEDGDRLTDGTAQGHHTAGRIDHGWARRKETKHLAQAPSSYLRRFTYDTIAHSKPIMEFVISMVGADRVMIGSDYCFDMGYERPVGFVEELNLSAEERKMILGTTAARLLKLDGKAAG